MNRICFALAAALFLIATGLQGDDRSDRTTSINQLQTLGTLVVRFANSHEGRLPKTLEELIAYEKADPSLLIAPMATDKSKPSYELILPAERISQVQRPSRTVIIRLRYKLADGKIPAAFVDGHVELLDPESLDAESGSAPKLTR